MINYSNPIVMSNDTASRELQEWIQTVDRWIPILGEGSPEGVVEAPLYSLYIDKNGLAGAIEYRKMSSEIGGDRSQGWLAV